MFCNFKILQRHFIIGHMAYLNSLNGDFQEQLGLGAEGDTLNRLKEEAGLFPKPEEESIWSTKKRKRKRKSRK